MSSDNLTNVTLPVESGSTSAGRRSSIRALWKDRRGVSAVVLALSLSSILGTAGLAVDAGVWYNDKRTLQGVADLAAWSAAQTYGTDVQNNIAAAAAITDAQNAAQAVATANGVHGVTVAVNSPAASGPNTGVAGTFEVILRKPESLFFSSQYLKSLTVAARAVSEYTTTTTGSGSPGCILALNTLEIDHGAKVTSANLTTSGCGIDVNGAEKGPSTYAFTVDSGAQVTVDSLNVVGGTSANSNQLTVTGSDVQSGGKVTPDPYAGITLANVESAAPGPTCPASTNPTSVSGTTSNSASPTTISPGYYCGGLSISGDVTLSPGVYVVSGGTFNVGDGATATATSGVTIILTGNATVDIDSGGELDITAPTTGPTAGLAFYGDPANTGTMTFSDGSKVNANGAFYFPAATVSFASGSDNTSNAVINCAQLVGYNIILFPGGKYTLTDNNCQTYGVSQIGGTVLTNAIKMAE
ncbi:MAG TPA: pilus assembly protein TadG-related protein [Caulobacteraceae bacterium]|jgi:Flp pilus assembly protein TadG